VSPPTSIIQDVSDGAAAPSWRNVAVLAAAQALAASGGPLVTLAGGIVGQTLAPSPLLATLPITALVIGVAISSVPVAMLMRRIGRRAGFMTGAAISTSGSLLAAAATSQRNFALFCLATLIMGAGAAFVQQYRFAAAESVGPQHTGRAVSFVLVGGIIAGVLGPEIGRRGRLWFGSEFSGAFVVVAIIQTLAIALLGAIRMPPQAAASHSSPSVPISAFFARPAFVLAIAAAAAGYAVMSFIMTATPISMHVHDGHSLDQTAFTIQSHVIAMFAPSLVTGFLVDRLGITRMMGAGAVTLLGSLAAGASSHSATAYWTGLVLLGLGWNLLFVGATVLLTRSYTPEERFRAQGLNDVAVFGSQSLASLASGAALHRLGWVAMNLAVAPILLLVLALIVTTRRTPQLGQA
jgi:predicted MFS family arabinose efflux permease